MREKKAACLSGQMWLYLPVTEKIVFTDLKDAKLKNTESWMTDTSRKDDGYEDLICRYDIPSHTVYFACESGQFRLDPITGGLFSELSALKEIEGLERLDTHARSEAEKIKTQRHEDPDVQEHVINQKKPIKKPKAR